MIRTINPLRAAFKIVLVLEEEGISYGRLDEVLEMAKDLINFTPIKHNPSNELHICLRSNATISYTGILDVMEHMSICIATKMYQRKRVDN